MVNDLVKSPLLVHHPGPDKRETGYSNVRITMIHLVKTDPQMRVPTNSCKKRIQNIIHLAALVALQALEDFPRRVNDVPSPLLLACIVA